MEVQDKCNWCGLVVNRENETYMRTPDGRCAYCGNKPRVELHVEPRVEMTWTCRKCGHKHSDQGLLRCIMCNATRYTADEVLDVQPQYKCLYCRDTGVNARTGYQCLHCENGIALVYAEYANENMEERRAYQRLRYGICSDRDCNEPIAGWCETCDRTGLFHAPKLCVIHLQQHLHLMEAYPHIAWLYPSYVADAWPVWDRLR